MTLKNLAYDGTDEYADAPSKHVMDGYEWRLAWVTTSSIQGRFYVRHDGAGWHLWYPTMGASIILVKDEAIISVT